MTQAAHTNSPTGFERQSSPAKGSPLPQRLYSIDVFRALTMFFMIFVNDVSEVKNIPAWIGHALADADRLGFADTIFPIFLFIVGLSLPFALLKRKKRGDSFLSMAAYILLRSIALLVMGFLHVNLENYNPVALLPKAVWEIAITIGFFLIWMDYPDTLKKSNKYFLQGTGILVLMLMAWLFQGGTPASPVGLKPYWWGILGIIGWSYLVCALIFLLSKGNGWVQAAAFLFFLLINIASHTGWLGFSIWVIGNASAVTVTMAGVVVSLLYRNLAATGRDRLLWITLAAAGIGMLIVGFLIRPYAAGISKIRATPAWVAINIGISILVFELLMYAVDIKGKKDWFNSIRPGGTSTLTSYLIPYLLYSVYALTNFRYPDFFNEGIGGILRSFFIAFLVIWIAGLLEKRKIRLQL